MDSDTERHISVIRESPGLTTPEMSWQTGAPPALIEQHMAAVEAGHEEGQVIRAVTRHTPETGEQAYRWWPVETAAEHMARRIIERGGDQVREYREQYGEWMAQRARSRVVELWQQRREGAA